MQLQLVIGLKSTYFYNTAQHDASDNAFSRLIAFYSGRPRKTTHSILPNFACDVRIAFNLTDALVGFLVEQ